MACVEEGDWHDCVEECDRHEPATPPRASPATKRRRRASATREALWRRTRWSMLAGEGDDREAAVLPETVFPGVSELRVKELIAGELQASRAALFNDFEHRIESHLRDLYNEVREEDDKESDTSGATMQVLREVLQGVGDEMQRMSSEQLNLEKRVESLEKLTVGDEVRRLTVKFSEFDTVKEQIKIVLDVYFPVAQQPDIDIADPVYFRKLLAARLAGAAEDARQLRRAQAHAFQAQKLAVAPSEDLFIGKIVEIVSERTFEVEQNMKDAVKIREKKMKNDFEASLKYRERKLRDDFETLAQEQCRGMTNSILEVFREGFTAVAGRIAAVEQRLPSASPSFPSSTSRFN